MFKQIVLKRIVETYRKSVSVLWLSYTIGFRKLMKWLFAIATNKKEEIKIEFTFKSENVLLYLESTLTDIILLTEIFFLEVYYIKNCNSPRLIVDGGANKGLSAVYFSKIWPQSMIHCFEPNKELLQPLNKNLQCNEVNARVFNYALSDKDGYDYFEISSNHQYSKLSKKETGVKVKTIHLESFYNDKKIDLLKLDVEGAEEKVITSLQNNNIKCIIGEVHHNLIDENRFFNALSNHYHLRTPRLQQYISNPTVTYPIVTAVNKKL